LLHLFLERASHVPSALVLAWRIREIH